MRKADLRAKLLVKLEKRRKQSADQNIQIQTVINN